MEGEIAYNWGNEQETLGGSPDKTLTTPQHREVLIDSIRNLHCTGLGWVAKYNQNDRATAAGADAVQRAFGYRFVIQEFVCSERAEPGAELRFGFDVLNTGSAPFYANWPVEFSLLDAQDHSLVLQAELPDVDIRDWMSGDDWDEQENVYRVPALANSVDATVKIPENVPPGEYIAALSILDPAGRQPAVRFAVQNYFTGGRHPLGRVGIGVDVAGEHQLDRAVFDDPMAENRLGYQNVSFPKRSGYLSIPSLFDDEPEPDNKWVVGTDKTTLKAVSHNSWVCYRGFEFRHATNHFSVQAASESRGGRIEIRLGSQTGQMIGAVEVLHTGGWRKFKPFQTGMKSSVNGVHDLYLVFVAKSDSGDYLFDIESFKFDQR